MLRFIRLRGDARDVLLDDVRALFPLPRLLGSQSPPPV